MEFTSVKMRNNCAIYNLDSNNIFINPGSACIAETEHGVDIGYVLSGIPAFKSQECEARGKILRLASDDDIAQANSLIDLEKRSFEEYSTNRKLYSILSRKTVSISENLSATLPEFSKRASKCVRSAYATSHAS